MILHVMILRPQLIRDEKPEATGQWRMVPSIDARGSVDRGDTGDSAGEAHLDFGGSYKLLRTD